MQLLKELFGVLEEAKRKKRTRGVTRSAAAAVIIEITNVPNINHIVIMIQKNDGCKSMMINQDRRI